MLLNTWDKLNSWLEPAVDAVEAATGGFWREFDDIVDRSRQRFKKRKKRFKEAARIAEEIDRKLYLAQRAIEEEEARKAELERLTELVKRNTPVLRTMGGKIQTAMKAAIEKQTFSAMERLERELRAYKEEEEMFIQAAAAFILEQ